MPKTSVKVQTSQPASGTGHIAAIVLLIIVIGAAVWARFHFTSNSESFNRYMDGVHAMQAGNEQQAITIWEDLRLKDPAFPDTYSALATYYTNQGDADHSLELLQQAQANHL